MKIKTFLLFLFLIFFLHSNAQRVIKTINVLAKSAFQDFVMLPDQSMVALVNEKNQGRFYLVKLSGEGEVIWSSDKTNGFGVCLKYIDDALFVGGQYDQSIFNQISILKKYNPNGNQVWTQTYDAGFISSIYKTSSGDYFIGGNIDEIGSSSSAFLHKIDENGNLVSTFSFDLYSNSNLRFIFEDGNQLTLIFYATVVGAGFAGHVIIKFDPSSFNEIWRLDKDLGLYEDNFVDRSVGRFFGAVMDNNNKLIISGPADAYGSSLIYQVDREGTFVDEFSTFNVNAGTHPHDILLLDNGDYLLSGIYEDGLSEVAAFVERRRSNGEIIWRRSVESGTFITSNIVQDTIFLLGINENFNTASDFYKPLFVKMTSDGKLYNNKISINIFEDVDVNCTKDDEDIPIDAIKTNIAGRTIYTDIEGQVQIDLETGIYNLEVDLPPYFMLCEPIEEIQVTSDTGTIEYAVLIQQKDCQELNIGITHTELIRCQSNKVYIQYENTALQDIENAKIKLAVDPALEIVASSMDYIDNNGFYEFDIESIAALSKERIWLDLYTPCETDLHAVRCLDVSIDPHLSCNPDYEDGDRSKLTLSGSCVNGVTRISVLNRSVSEAATADYRIFSDGHKFEADNLSLAAGDEQVFSFESQGNTITFLLNETSSPSVRQKKSIAIEGCGRQSNGTYSKGFKQMMDGPESEPWKAKACLEVRDNYSGHRIFGINRGLGHYHIIDTSASTYQFGLRYKNDLNERIEDLEISINPGLLFDKNSFKATASSHDINVGFSSIGAISISGANLQLETGEEFHYQFELDLADHELETNTFAQLTASGVANLDKRITINSAYYNVWPSEFITTDTISPFTTMKDGFLFGRGHTIDFYEDMVLLSNNNLLIGGIDQELAFSYNLQLIMNSSDNEMLWEKTITFEEGAPQLSKILPVGNDKILLFGTVDDKNVPENYAIDQYAFIVAITENGEERWRKVWKPGAGPDLNGFVNNGVFTVGEKIILGGYRYVDFEDFNFVAEIDTAGNVVWQKDIVIGDNLNRSRIFVKEDADNKVLYGAKESDSAGKSFAMVRGDGLGNEISSGAYYYYETGAGGNMYVDDFDITNDNQIVLGGRGFDNNY